MGTAEDGRYRLGNGSEPGRVPGPAPLALGCCGWGHLLMPLNTYPRTSRCWPPGRTRPTWAAPSRCIPRWARRYGSWPPRSEPGPRSRSALAAAAPAPGCCPEGAPGRALDVLPRLSDGTYDMVFCDADPADYPDYLIAALRLLRPGGVVAFNNALPVPDGSEPPEDEADVAEQVRGDEGLVPLLMPLGNGLLAAVK